VFFVNRCHAVGVKENQYQKYVDAPLLSEPEAKLESCELNPI